MNEYLEKGKAQPKLIGKDHWFYMNKPMGIDVGYHALEKQWDGQEPRDGCDWLDGRPCYCDGSALRAEEWFNVIVREGSDKIWEMLEADYNERFK